MPSREPQFDDMTQYDGDDQGTSGLMKAADLDNHRGVQIPVEIERVTEEEFERDGQKEVKPVLWFKGKQKGLALNFTNRHRIIDVYGSNWRQWIGSKICLVNEALQKEWNGATRTIAVQITADQVQEHRTRMSSTQQQEAAAPAPGGPSPHVPVQEGDIPF